MVGDNGISEVSGSPSVAQRRCLNCIAPALPGRSVCARHQEWHRKHQAASVARRREAGLCVMCGKARDSSKSRCSDCRERYSRIASENRKARLRAGQCGGCDKPNPGPFTMCDDCRAKRAILRSRTPKIKAPKFKVCKDCGGEARPGFRTCGPCWEIAKEAEERRIAEHKARRICGCGTPLDSDRTKCDACADRESKRAKLQRQENVASGLCMICGGENTTKRKACEVCTDRQKGYNEAKRREKEAKGECFFCSRPLATQGIIPKCKYHWFKSLCNSSKWGGLPKSKANSQMLESIWDAQGGRCAYTGEPLVMGVNASLDHKMPVSRGGTNDKGNLQFVALQINVMKRDTTDEEFRAICKAVTAGEPCSFPILGLPNSSRRRRGMHPLTIRAGE